MKKLLFLLISILLSFCSIDQTFALNKKNFDDNFYTKETIPDVNNPLNYCTLWSGYSEKYLKLTYKFSGRYMDFECLYDDGRESLKSNGWIYLKEEPATPPPPPKIPGCTNPQALNYDPQATQDNGTCIEKIEGCTDSTAINYNPQANVHKESMCEYTPPYTPQDITGAFQKSQVSIGATTWTIRVNLNVSNANLDPSVIQTWNRFKAVSATTNEKTLEIVMRQFDDQRLEIEECTSYELTIPRNALYTTEGDTNANPISGNFEVIGCPEKPTNDDEQTGTGKIQEIQQKYKSTMNKDAFYVRLFDVDEDGNQHINLGNFIFLIGFAGFFISAMFLFLNFLKNSFIGKKSSR